MDSDEADTIDQNFETVHACLWMQRRLVALLFAANPAAMEALEHLTPEWVEIALLNDTFSDGFIAAAQGELTRVRAMADLILDKDRTG